MMVLLVRVSTRRITPRCRSIMSALVSTPLHHCGRHHIDALAVGPELVAVGASALTGDVWDGRLLLLRTALTPGGAKSCTVVAEASTPAGNATVAWIAPDTVVTGDDRGDVTLWQLGGDAHSGATLSPVLTLQEHAQPVGAVAVGAVRTRLASVSHDGTAKVWTAMVGAGDAITLDHLPVHSWCDVQVHSAVWLGAATQVLATGASDGVVRLWDLRTAKPPASRFAPHSAPLLSLVVGAAENQLLGGGECGSTLLYDARKLDAPVMSTPAQKGGLSSLSMPGGGGGSGGGGGGGGGVPLLASASQDGILCVRDPRDLEPIATLAGAHSGNAAAVAWLEGGDDGKTGTLLSGGWDKALLCHELRPAASAQ